MNDRIDQFLDPSFFRGEKNRSYFYKINRPEIVRVQLLSNQWR